MNTTKKPRVLVACEYSGTVRDAFAARGWDAWSCDLLPTDAPGLHYQGDVCHLLDGWVPVRHQCECDPDGDGWCRLTDTDPSDCPCIGPTQDEVEYLERDGVLFGRPEAGAGSASHAIAAHYFGAHLTACEIDADYYAAAMARIKRETAQTTLFT